MTPVIMRSTEKISFHSPTDIDLILETKTLQQIEGSNRVHHQAFLRC